MAIFIPAAIAIGGYIAVTKTIKFLVTRTQAWKDLKAAGSAAQEVQAILDKEDDEYAISRALRKDMLSKEVSDKIKEDRLADQEDNDVVEISK